MPQPSTCSSNAGTGASTPNFGYSSIWHNVERVDSSNTVASGDTTRYLDEELASLVSTLSALQTNKSNTNTSATNSSYYFNDNITNITTTTTPHNHFHRLQMSTLDGDVNTNTNTNTNTGTNTGTATGNSRRFSSSSSTSDLTFDSEDQAANIAAYINEFTSDDVDIFASSNTDANGGKKPTTYSIGTAPPFTSNIFNPNNNKMMMMSSSSFANEQGSTYSQSISVGLDGYSNANINANANTSTRDASSDTTTKGNSEHNGYDENGEDSNDDDESRDNFNVIVGGANDNNNNNEYRSRHKGNRYSASITGPILGKETYQYFHDAMANNKNNIGGSEVENGQGSFFQQLGKSLVEGTKQLESSAEISSNETEVETTAEAEAEEASDSANFEEHNNSAYFTNVVSSVPAFKPAMPPNQQYFFGFPPQLYGTLFPQPPIDNGQRQGQNQNQKPQSQSQSQSQQHFPIVGPSNFLSQIIHPGLPPSAPLLHQGQIPVPGPIPVQMATASQPPVVPGENSKDKEAVGVPSIGSSGTPPPVSTSDIPPFIPVPQAQPGTPMVFVAPGTYRASPTPTPPPLQPAVLSSKDAQAVGLSVSAKGAAGTTTGFETSTAVTSATTASPHSHSHSHSQLFSSPKERKSMTASYSKGRISGAPTRIHSESQKKRSSSGGGQTHQQQHSRSTQNSHLHPYQHSRSSHRSALLEEIRNSAIRDEAREANGRRKQQQQQQQAKKTSAEKEYTLRDINGHALEFCRDQYGSRFIQKQLAVASAEEKNSLFNEIKNQALILASDVFGNYVIQKFFEFGSNEQRNWLLDQFEGKVKQLSTDMYACRVIQTALEYIDTERCVTLVFELDGSVLRMIKDQNGNHVIQKAVERIPLSRIPFVLDSIRGHVYNLATHSYGCRVIQRLLEFGTADDQKVILGELSEFIPLLIEDQYGNYVIQYVLEHGSDQNAPLCMTDMKQQIMNIVSKNVVEFSKHKFASNVVEKTVLYGTPEQKEMILSRILPRDEDHAAHLEDNAPLILMIRDQFANYVVQKLVPATEGEGKKLIVIAIKSYLDKLNKSGSSGNRHLASVEKLAALVQSVEL